MAKIKDLNGSLSWVNLCFIKDYRGHGFRSSPPHLISKSLLLNSLLVSCCLSGFTS